MNIIKVKHKQYNDSHLKYGFSATDDKSQCAACYELLSTESMISSKLIRHLETVENQQCSVAVGDRT
jgi:hypothetical protein